LNSLKPGLGKKIQLNLFAQHKKLLTSVHDLNYLFWECTLRCNMNCGHCGSDCFSSSSLPDMPAEHFLGVLDSIRNKMNPGKITIAITGGEPIMRKDLENTGEKMAVMGVPWGIVTNGWDLSKNRLNSLLSAGMKTMTISIDGMEESHEWLRKRKGSFRRAVNALYHAAHSSIPIFDAVTCLTQKNVNELPEIRDLLLGIGVRRWRIFSIFPKGRAAQDADLKLTGLQLQNVMEFIKATRQAGKMKASYSCDGFLGSYEKEIRDDFMFCRAGISVASVLIDGSISACPSLRSDFIQGNIYKDDFLDCWENRFHVMRNRSWARTGQCADCSSWKWCLGNGLHLRDEMTGGLLMCQLLEMNKS
jgi:radical SAM enzyme (rSAM/lipoprotein system)